MKNSILFVGTFVLPDGNAAAIRVRGIAGALIEAGYNVIMQGENVSQTELSFDCDGFKYKTRRQWGKIDYYYNIDYILKTVDEIGVENLKAIIMYHIPAIIAIRLNAYCKKNDIILIADTTEWYSIRKQLYSGNVLLRALNFWLRIYISNTVVKNNIVISSFLARHYRNLNTLIVPILSIEQSDFVKRSWNEVRICYCGSPSKKDMLLPVVMAIEKGIDEGLPICLKILGCTKEGFERENKYTVKSSHMRFIEFDGRIPHEMAVETLRCSDFSIIIRPNERYANAGFPTKLVEAFSCGAGVIATKTSDIPLYVHDGENGFLLNSVGFNELLSLFRDICTLSSEKIDSIRFNAYNCAKKHFNTKAYSGRLKDFIEGAPKEYLHEED